MRAHPLFILPLVVGLAAACGPKSRAGDDAPGDDTPPGDDAPDASTTPVGDPATVSGRVWAPAQAPGLVPAGQEIPVFGAVVYLSSGRPAGIPQQVHCEQCIDLPGNAVTTAHDGSFTLDVTSGDQWLVIQKGQFRIEQQLAIQPGPNALGAAETTMPSVHDPANGRWIPRIAIAVGGYDQLEDILGKIGLGSVDGTGNYSATDGEVTVWSNGGSDLGMAAGTLAQLAGNLAMLRNFHILLIPCSGDQNAAALQDQNVLRNLRTYVAEGGKLYVTDWSGEWMDNVFPAQIKLGASPFEVIDTPASAYDPATNTWNPGAFGNADGDAYDSNDGEVVDDDLHTWLHGQIGPLPGGGAGMFDASHFDVVENWNWIETLTEVAIGTDASGMTVYDTPRPWVIGSRGIFGGGVKHPLTVTFEPAGCGRVLFSTYHTTPEAHVGLYPQERILLYLLMEIGVCHEGPIVVE